MTRARTPVVLAALTAVAALAAAAADPPAPPAPLRRALERAGYVAVPLAQDEGGGFTVACTIGGTPCRLLVDTGAESSALDAAVARRLGLKFGDEVEGVGAAGTHKGAELTLRGLAIGAFDTRAMAGSVSFAAFDLGALNAVRDRRKLPRIDGVLGHSALRHGSAVIDYPTRTLYLRTPLAGLWPEVEGQWVATAGQEGGRARAVDPAAPPRLEFKDRRLRLTDGAKGYAFGVHARPARQGHVLALFDPDRELDAELTYTAAGLLKVEGERLVVCLCLDPAKGVPDDFTAPADSGRLLLEFRRKK